MSLNNSQSSSPPKRPRLSLQIKTPAAPQVLGKSVTALKTDVDLSSPTAFNTLSNAYAAAIEASSPRTAKPLVSANKTAKPTFLRLETSNVSNTDYSDKGYIHPSQRTQTPGPFSIAYPDTPTSAFPTSATIEPENDGSLQILPATTFSFTPPQSAGTEKSAPRIFTFAAHNASSPSTPRTPRRRMTIGSQYQVAPYTHPRSLHSILRNSPLPPRPTATPLTPGRSSMRISTRASKKVEYNNPLTQTITTNKYVHSHIDLLVEDSPCTAIDPEVEAEKLGSLDLAMAYTGDETRDGGQTPGPFEEMRRRMADSDLETPGAKKRKRKEKKRRWEWTISSTETDGDEDLASGPVKRTPLTATAAQIEDTPITAFPRGSSVSEDDSEASEVGERWVMPSLSEDSEMEEWGGSVASEPELERVSEVDDGRPRTAQSL